MDEEAPPPLLVLAVFLAAAVLMRNCSVISFAMSTEGLEACYKKGLLVK